MKRFLIPAGAVAALFAAASVFAAPSPGPEHRLVLVSVDGMPPTDYLEPDAHGLKVPNLRKLAAEGGFAHGVAGVLPTNTYPSHATLVTGVPPRIHRVLSNVIFDPGETSNHAWYWYADEVKAPTLASAAKAAGMKVGSISWPSSLGLQADALFPDFWRTGSTNPDDLRLLSLLSTPGLVAATEKELGRGLSYPVTDDERTAMAIHVLETLRPELLQIHLLEYDHYEHENGIDSPQAKAALERDDADLGRLREAIGRLGLDGETLFAVVSDHGFLPTEIYLHPNAMLRDAGLLKLDDAGKVASWKAIFWTQGGSALLRLADPQDRKTLDSVRALVSAKASEPGSGIAAVLSADDVNRFGGDPDLTPLGLDAASHYSFTFSANEGWATPAIDKAGHGFAPTHPELQASLLLDGAGVARRGDLGVVPMTAIAPTLAQWLGIQLDPRADSPRDWLEQPVSQHEP